MQSTMTNLAPRPNAPNAASMVGDLTRAKCFHDFSRVTMQSTMTNIAPRPNAPNAGFMMGDSTREKFFVIFRE